MDLEEAGKQFTLEKAGSELEGFQEEAWCRPGPFGSQCSQLSGARGFDIEALCKLSASQTHPTDILQVCSLVWESEES